MQKKEEKVKLLVSSHKESFISNLGARDLEDTDDVVGVTGKEGVSVSGPGDGDSSGGVGLVLDELLSLDLRNEVLGLQIPDLDGLYTSEITYGVDVRKGREL